MSDYPTEDELEAVRRWTYNGPEEWTSLVEYLQEIFWQPDWCISIGRKYVYISTGGWSGNEDIMNSLSDNYLIWTIYWQSSRVGGHYKFLKSRKFA